jgi:hypothetical protein
LGFGNIEDEMHPTSGGLETMPGKGMVLALGAFR